MNETEKNLNEEFKFDEFKFSCWDMMFVFVRVVADKQLNTFAYSIWI